MTHYTLTRVSKSDISTVGLLFRNKDFMCFSLEDRDRILNSKMLEKDIKAIKVPKATAIPTGHYEVIINYSNRFKHNLPYIKEVKGFTGIRIHKGNRHKDTEGCILLGLTASREFVNESTLAFLKFYDQLEIDLKKGKVFLTIESAYGSTVDPF